jgi:hypothetical protein
MASAVQSDLAATLPANEKLANVVVTPIPSVLTSTPHAFGQRVVATISYPGKSGKQGQTDVYIDVQGFPHGTALVEAEFETPGKAPSNSLTSTTMAALLKSASGS